MSQAVNVTEAWTKNSVHFLMKDIIKKELLRKAHSLYFVRETVFTLKYFLNNFQFNKICWILITVIKS